MNRPLEIARGEKQRHIIYGRTVILKDFCPTVAAREQRAPEHIRHEP